MCHLNQSYTHILTSNFSSSLLWHEILTIISPQSCLIASIQTSRFHSPRDIPNSFPQAFFLFLSHVDLCISHLSCESNLRLKTKNKSRRISDPVSPVTTRQRSATGVMCVPVICVSRRRVHGRDQRRGCRSSVDVTEPKTGNPFSTAVSKPVSLWSRSSTNEY